MMAVFNKGDVENGDEKYADVDGAVGYVGDENAVHKDEFTAGDSLYAKLQRFAGRFGVEQRGIERVPSDERTDTSLSKVGTLVGSPTTPSSSGAPRRRGRHRRHGG